MNAACKWYGARPGPCCALRAGGQGAGKPVLASYVRTYVPPAYLAFYVGFAAFVCVSRACVCVEVSVRDGHGESLSVLVVQEVPTYVVGVSTG